MKRNLLSLPPAPPDKRVSFGDDPNQFFDLWEPANARAVAIMIHGGFWRAKYDLLHTSHLCAALAKNGLAVANLEYRRVGNAGGGWPGTYDDIRAAFAAVRRHSPAQNKFVLLGHSAGGHLALRLAIDAPELVGIVALAPVAVLQTAYDLHLSRDAVVDFLGGTPASIPEIYEDACPSRHSSLVRRILVHGTKDADVPLSISEEFCKKRGSDQGVVRQVTLEDADHYDLIDPRSNAWPAVMESVFSLP